MEITQTSQKVLRDHYRVLETSLDAQALSGALFSKGLITLELNEELSLVHTTRAQKNGILLRYLLRNPSPNLIPQLCEILHAEEANKHLASTLEGYSIIISAFTTVVHCVNILQRLLKGKRMRWLLYLRHLMVST